jgi:general secretion pathway protein I
MRPRKEDSSSLKKRSKKLLPISRSTESTQVDWHLRARDKSFLLLFFRKDDLPSDSGFTLLEAIVAFVISALAVALLYQGATAGLIATETSAKTTEAVLLAKSHLAAIGHGAPIAPQESHGTDGDGFSWKLHVKAIATREMNLSDSDRANDTKPTNAVLYDITVTESWQDGPRTRAVSIGTHRFDMRTADG